MHRSSVDFPDPLGPMMQMVLPASTVMLTPSSTRRLPKLFTRFRTSSTGVSLLLSPGIGLSPSLSRPPHLRYAVEATHHPLDRVAQNPVEAACNYECFERHKKDRLHLVGPERQLGDRNNHQERRVLDDLDHLVPEDWAGRDEELRTDDAHEELDAREAECHAPLLLLRRQVAPRAAEDLREIRGVIDDER